jgi:hypothetical protein
MFIKAGHLVRRTMESFDEDLDPCGAHGVEPDVRHRPCSHAEPLCSGAAGQLLQLPGGRRQLVGFLWMSAEAGGMPAFCCAGGGRIGGGKIGGGKAGPGGGPDGRAFIPTPFLH